MRSNGCGDLRKQQIDEQVQLCGWVDRRRDHGGVIFIDLRDRSGVFSNKGGSALRLAVGIEELIRRRNDPRCLPWVR